MAEKYYLDTSIWMDYFEERKDPSKDLGEIAFKLLYKLLASRSKILVSYFILIELELYVSLDEIRGILRPFECVLERVGVSTKQKEEAEMLAKARKLPKGDALHAILARDNQAILVTRDKHFHSLKDVCEIVKPEEII
jgi:predicted nucleic acid-binding protein